MCYIEYRLWMGCKSHLQQNIHLNGNWVHIQMTQMIFFMMRWRFDDWLYSKQVWNDSFAVLWIVGILFYIPVMREEGGHTLVRYNKEDDAQQSQMTCTSNDGKRNVNDHFHEEMWTGDVFEKSSSGNEMTGTHHLTWNKTEPFEI